MTTAFLDMRLDFPQTSLWNESASPSELIESIGWGVTGAAPDFDSIRVALVADPDRFAERLDRLMGLYPTAPEPHLARLLAEDVLLDVAATLSPTFEKYSGREGRVSMPTDPTSYRDAEALVEQATGLNALTPNALAAIPVIAPGLTAIEEATVLGVSVNAVGCVSASQALAAAEAIERGLARRERDGHETSRMAPLVSLHVGVLDLSLAALAESRGLLLEPGVCDYAGIAVFKDAYRMFAERAYTARLAAADIRSAVQVTELLGGDVVLAPPHDFQRRLGPALAALRHRIEQPVPAERVSELTRQLPEFDQAHSPDALAPADFEKFGPVARIMRRHHREFASLTTVVIDALYPAS